VEADSPDEPDLCLEGFRLWVHDRQFPDAADYWDGNWLRVTARMEANGARVETSGALIRVDELAAFSKELKKLVETLVATAELRCLEPNLHLLLQGDGLGHVAVTVTITPDQLTQSHRFIFGVEQTYLWPLATACDDILWKFPLRGSL
jgi:hypothetical protein